MTAITYGVKRAEWISPEQQLKILGQDEEGVIKEIVGTNERPGLPEVLARIVVKYALSPNLIKWYRVLKDLSILPDAIPPLPFEVSDTESLYLRPPLSVNEMTAIVNAYGEANLGANHSLKFRSFYSAIRQEHGDVRPREWQWISLTSDVLEGSRGKSYFEQAALVAGLGANYKIPTLLEVITVIFFDYIAARYTPFQEGNELNQDRYTRVRERTLGYSGSYPLIVGGFDQSGLDVSYTVVDGDNIGLAAVRNS